MPPKLAIIGVSGRALAQSATKAGASIVVLDAHGDRDTSAVAKVIRVATGNGLALDAARVRAALAAEAAAAKLDILIASGFEHHPEVTRSFGAYGRLYANDPAIVRALKDPELGSALLRAMGCDVPVTRRARPAERRGWLQKEIGGTGGIHIRRADGAHGGARAYFQREVRGVPMSVTFLADGEREYVLGFNRLRVAALGAAPFCYAGGVGGIEIAPALRGQVEWLLARLVRLTSLRGLAGLDFMLDGDAMTVLEVNPRPTATFDLYDDDFAEGLAHWHMLSFERPIPEFGERLGWRSSACRAVGVVYAPGSVRIPANAAFPIWCRDVPHEGTLIRKGTPVVSVFAAGSTSADAERLLDARSGAVHDMLAEWTLAPMKARMGRHG